MAWWVKPQHGHGRLLVVLATAKLRPELTLDLGLLRTVRE